LTVDDNTEAENAGDVAALSAGVAWHRPKDVIRSGVGDEMRMETGTDGIDNPAVCLWFQYVK